MPHDARTLVEFAGAQIAPTRGASWSRVRAVTARPGKPSSPGKIRPAGAFGKTLLLVPAVKRSMSKRYTRSSRLFIGRDGAPRTPELSVNDCPTRHASCA